MYRIFMIMTLLLSQFFFGQVNISSKSSSAEIYLKDINKLFLIEFVNDDYLIKESLFIKESDIIQKNWPKRDLALNSIKFLSKNSDTIYLCDRGLNFNKNQVDLFKLNKMINESNFEKLDSKNIPLLNDIIIQIEKLPKLEEATKLQFRKQQLLNLCVNYKQITEIKSSNFLSEKYNKAQIDLIVELLVKLPILDESENVEITKQKLIGLCKDYEMKIQALIQSLEKNSLLIDNPSSPIRDAQYDKLIKDYINYPFLMSVIEKAKKNKNAFKSELSYLFSEKNDVISSKLINSGENLNDDKSKSPDKLIKENKTKEEDKKIQE